MLQHFRPHAIGVEVQAPGMPVLPGISCDSSPTMARPQRSDIQSFNAGRSRVDVLDFMTKGESQKTPHLEFPLIL